MGFATYLQSPIPLLVNVLKGKLWDEEPEPVATKDKNSFRQYDSACERVKAFYKEQHGRYYSSTKQSWFECRCREANGCIQHQSAR